MLGRSLLRKIRSTFGRFLAIFAIIALGVGFFIGLRVTHDAMLETAGVYLEALSLYDFRLISTLGLTEEDVEAFRKEETVFVAQGSVSSDALVALSNGTNEVFWFHSLLEDVNRVEAVKGRLPRTANEAVLDATFFNESWIGKDVVLSPQNDEDTKDLFRYDTYHVVGLVDSPYYINFERGSTDLGSGVPTGFAYVLPSAFDASYYTEIFLRMKGMPPAGTDAYDQKSETLLADLETLLERRGEIRYEALQKEAEGKIEEAQSGIDDGWEKIADGRIEIADAQMKLLDAREELEDARVKLEDGKIELRDAERELEDAREKLSDARKELDDGLREYEDGLLEYEEGKAKYEDGLREYEEGVAAYEDGLREYEEGVSLYDSEYASYIAQKNEAIALINEQEAQIESAEASLAALQAGLSAANAQKAALQASLPSLSGEALSQATTLLATLEAQIATMEAQNAMMAPLVASGRATFDTAKADAEAGFLAAENEFARAWSELFQAKRTLDSGKEELLDAEKTLSESKKELEEAEETLLDAKKKLDDGEAEYRDGLAEYEQGLSEYEDGKKELEEGEAEYRDGLEEYRRESEKAAASIRDAEADIADAERDLSDGQTKVNDAKEELGKLKAPSVYVLDRDANAGYAALKNDTAIVKGIAKVFPLFFFLIAALVCMTTMTRMIDESRTENGTLKALGYSDSRIIMQYLIYAGSASLFGCFVGFFAGSRYMPMAIWQVYRIMYSIDRPVSYVLDWKMFAISAVGYFLLALGSTLAVCRRDLTESAAELIRPKSPEAGKRVFLERIPFVWKRLDFLRKVSIRNIFLYKKRMVMMLIGIGGCTALLLTGFGIRDTIKHIVDYQYEEISVYDAIVTLTEELTEEEERSLVESTEGAISDAAFLSLTPMDLMEEETESVNVAVFREPLDSFIDLHVGKEPIPWPEKGEAVLNYRIAKAHGISVGDTISVADGDFRTLSLRVTGIFDNYLYDYVYVSEDTVLEAWGEAPAVKNAYVNLEEGADIHRFSAKMLSEEKVASVVLSEDTMTTIDSMLKSMDYVVLIVLVCAGALAFIVLYNLTNISITERKREIATLKVLGFYQPETATYVFRENLILTGLAALVGIPMGILLLRYVMSQIVIRSMYFGCRIAPLSYVFSVAITFIFALLIDLALRRKIDGIDMAESMKAIE